MSDPVLLAVSHAAIDAAGGVNGQFWLYVHTEPPDATVTCELTSVGGKAVLHPTTLDKPKGVPYNKIYRVENHTKDKVFRLHVKATSEGRTDAHYSLLVSFAEMPRSAPPKITNITLPNPVSAQNGFMVGGNVTPTTATMSAWLSPVVGTTGCKPVVPPPAPYNWAFCFPGGMTAGTQYTLYVQAQTNTVVVVPTNFTPQ